MANNSLVKLMRQKYEEGVEAGWNAFCIAAGISGYNASEEVDMDEELFFRFFRAWEKDIVRLFTEECHNNPEAALLLKDKADWVRIKAGLEAVE